MLPPGGRLPAWGKLATSPAMAFVFENIGWEDENGHRHTGDPADEGVPIDDVWGMVVFAYDEQNPDDQQIFTAYLPIYVDDWDDWWDYITLMMEDYGMVNS